MRGGGAIDGVARSRRRWTIYDNPTNPFRGWSMVTVVVAVLGAVGGILVALVIKYADGLAKSLSTASSIVLTTAASLTCLPTGRVVIWPAWHGQDAVRSGGG